jgi:hypothetical protein
MRDMDLEDILMLSSLHSDNYDMYIHQNLDWPWNGERSTRYTSKVAKTSDLNNEQ